MAKTFIDVEQDSPRTSLGIPVKTKKSLSRTTLPLAGPLYGFQLHKRLVPVLNRERLFRHPFARDAPPCLRVCSVNPGVAPARRA